MIGYNSSHETTPFRYMWRHLCNDVTSSFSTCSVFCIFKRFSKIRKQPKTPYKSQQAIASTKECNISRVTAAFTLMFIRVFL